jgi:hypothetical protein
LSHPLVVDLQIHIRSENYSIFLLQGLLPNKTPHAFSSALTLRSIWNRRSKSTHRLSRLHTDSPYQVACPYCQSLSYPFFARRMLLSWPHVQEGRRTRLATPSTNRRRTSSSILRKLLGLKLQKTAQNQKMICKNKCLHTQS